MNGLLGVVGLELTRDIVQEKTFTVIDNSSSTLLKDSNDGDMTMVATSLQPGNVGVHFLDSITVVNGASCVTEDNIDAETITVDECSSLEANNMTLPGQP